MKAKLLKIFSIIIVSVISLGLIYCFLLTKYDKIEIKAGIGIESAQEEKKNLIKKDMEYIENNSYFFYDIDNDYRSNYRYRTSIDYLLKKPELLYSILKKCDFPDGCNKISAAIAYRLLDRYNNNIDNIIMDLKTEKLKIDSRLMFYILSFNNRKSFKSERVSFNDFSYFADKYIAFKEKECSLKKDTKRCLFYLLVDINNSSELFHLDRVKNIIKRLNITNNDFHNEINHNGITPAIYLAISLLNSGDEIEIDKGIEILKKRSSRGDPLSQAMLTNYYYYIKRNNPEAIKYAMLYLNNDYSYSYFSYPSLLIFLIQNSVIMYDPKFILYQIHKENNNNIYKLDGDYYLSIYDSIYGKYLEEGCESNTISGRYGREILNYCRNELADYYLANELYDKALTVLNDIAKFKKDRTSSDTLLKLGSIYYEGLGVRQDLEKAKEYYGRACDLKDQNACSFYREVNEKIR